MENNQAIQAELARIEAEAQHNTGLFLERQGDYLRCLQFAEYIRAQGGPELHVNIIYQKYAAQFAVFGCNLNAPDLNDLVSTLDRAGIRINAIEDGCTANNRRWVIAEYACLCLYMPAFLQPNIMTKAA